jgi:hypothetical protein
MYWMSSPLLLEKGQALSITCTVKERLMDFEVTTRDATSVAGSALAAVFHSLNSVPAAVMGFDTISENAQDSEHVAHASSHYLDCDGSIDVIWCPEYTVLRCNDSAWRLAVVSDLAPGRAISILCLGDPLAFVPLIYRAEGAHVVVDYAELEEDQDATFDALWDHLHSRHLQGLQHMQYLCNMPPGIVFDLIFWDPVEPGGLLRSGCFQELVASRTKNSRRNSIIAPCTLILWAQGVTGTVLDDMTEVRASKACGFDLSYMNNYSVHTFRSQAEAKSVDTVFMRR